MGLTQRTITIAGFALLMTAILTILTIGFTAAGTSDESPFEKEHVAKYLEDTEENATTLDIAGAIGIINDGVFVLLAGAALFTIFRDRSRLLSAIWLAGVAVTVAISLSVDATNILIVEIAKDYVRGGPPGVDVHSAATLELGRYIGMITMAFTNLLFTPAGIAFTALGILLVSAPQGAVNPPKWMGWLGVVGGLSFWGAWLVVAAEPFFVFFIINLLATEVFLFALGIWLLMNSSKLNLPATMSSTA